MPSHTEPLSEGSLPVNQHTTYPTLTLLPLPTIFAPEDKPARQATTETTLSSSLALSRNRNTEEPKQPTQISPAASRPAGTRGEADGRQQTEDGSRENRNGIDHGDLPSSVDRVVRTCLLRQWHSPVSPSSRAQVFGTGHGATYFPAKRKQTECGECGGWEVNNHSVSWSGTG